MFIEFSLELLKDVLELFLKILKKFKKNSKREISSNMMYLTNCFKNTMWSPKLLIKKLL